MKTESAHEPTVSVDLTHLIDDRLFCSFSPARSITESPTGAANATNVIRAKMPNAPMTPIVARRIRVNSRCSRGAVAISPASARVSRALENGRTRNVKVIGAVAYRRTANGEFDVRHNAKSTWE